FTSINFTAGTLSTISSLVAATPTNQKATTGYNFAATGATGVTGDRALGSSPTGTAGTILELSMVNNTGDAITNLQMSYDIDRFTTTTTNGTVASGSPNSGVEEFPGYQLFYNLTPSNAATWVNVSSLNPTINAGTGGAINVPNSVGVTSISNAGVTLDSAWAAGSTIAFAWFDDNAEDSSPDQLIGLNNVSIAAVPEPSAGILGLVAMGVAFTLVRRRKQRSA
ncbi:MAG TPA: PEP-CTERM sorting domain-containing protein, partial [Lacunisphaera sp.]